MKLQRYVSQEGLPSRTSASPVDFQHFDTTGKGIDMLGQSLSAVGEHLYAADAPERAALRRQEEKRLKLEEDLATQEAVTTYKTRAAEILERRRTEYSPGMSDEDRTITDFAKSTISELRETVNLEAFDTLPRNVKARFKTEALRHIDSLIPELNRTRTEMLVAKSEARLGQSKAFHEHMVNQAASANDVLDAADGYAGDLGKAVESGSISPDKAVERANKFNASSAENWFNARAGQDPEALFRSMQSPTPEEKYLFGFINGKDAKGFSDERKRQVLDEIDRKRKTDERTLKDQQNAIENNFWDGFFRGQTELSGRITDRQNAEIKKLEPERYKSIVKQLSEARDSGGVGDENKMNYWKMRLFHNSQELSGDNILNMSELNWKQRQELYAAKRTQASFEETVASNGKHWANDPNYKFYGHELQDQLGIIKLSPFTNASALQLLSQAEIAYRTEYERIHTEKKGNVSQQEASDLMKQIVTTTRQSLGFKAQVYGDIPRFTDARDLDAARQSGKISEAEFTREYQKLKAWRGMQGTEDPQAGASSGMTPKKDFKKHGKE